MAENSTGMDSSSCGGSAVSILPSALLLIPEGFFPRNTFVSIGSRSGSIGGLVT